MKVAFRRVFVASLVIFSSVLLYAKMSNIFHRCSRDAKLVNCIKSSIIADTSNVSDSLKFRHLEDQEAVHTKDHVRTSESNGYDQTKQYFQILTHYMLLSEDDWIEHFTEHFSSMQINERQRELSETLQRNLNHPLVSHIHILIYKQEEIDYINNLHLNNSHKLILYTTRSVPNFGVALQYVNKNLLNQTAVLLNSDCYLGEGFELVNASILKSQKIIYSLTRRGKQERLCMAKDYCGVDYQYIGSHDAFIFHFTQKIPDSVIKAVAYSIGDSGSENVFMYVLKSELGMNMLNTCPIIKIFHNHCSSVRPQARVRVNNGRYVHASFTSSLTGT